MTIPGNIKLLDHNTFGDCTGLKKITIENGCQSISESFIGCTSLKELSIPNSVISMAGNIKKPFCFGEEAFGDISDNCILYIPKGTKQAYIASGWTEDVFKGGIVELDETYTGIKNSIKVDTNTIEYYNMNGQQISPHMKSIILKRMRDGSVKKVLIK